MKLKDVLKLIVGEENTLWDKDIILSYCDEESNKIKEKLIDNYFDKIIIAFDGTLQTVLEINPMHPILVPFYNSTVTGIDTDDKGKIILWIKMNRGDVFPTL